MTPGTEIGSYRVLSRLGAGGMGEVWLAEHVTLGRRAALKVLHAELSVRPDVVTRFFNEARAATAISDPGIVQIFDFGQHRDGSAYIVMELLEGEALDRRLRRLGALALPDALRIMRQVATSLGAAHARGIIHRDLKPENVFIVRDVEVAYGERPKLLDFGIAKLLGETAGVKTQTASILGTPTYMSPEQCRGAGEIDPRSDVYALGCMLFVLVTGRPPFDAEGIGEIIAKHLYERAPSASSVASGIPHAVDELIARCLAKDPGDRFASAAELAAALAQIHPTGTPVITLGPGATAQVPTTLSAAAGEVPKPRRRAGIAAALVSAIVVVGLVAWRLGSTSDEPWGPPPPAPIVTAPVPAPTPVPDLHLPSISEVRDSGARLLDLVRSTPSLHWRAAPTAFHSAPQAPPPPPAPSPCGGDIPSCK